MPITKKKGAKKEGNKRAKRKEVNKREKRESKKREEISKRARNRLKGRNYKWELTIHSWWIKPSPVQVLFMCALHKALLLSG